MSLPKVTQLNPQLKSILTSYWQWRKFCVVTTIAFFVIGLAYAVVLKKDTWVASQALIVRDEATGAVMRLGRFESQTQMKAAQETVLEMARNPQVVEAALKAVGRPARFWGLLKSDAPPSRSEIESFANSSVTVRAPRGAELGTTEIIYIDVKQGSKERAVQLTTALCDALEVQLKAVRIELADGVIAELEAARAVCDASLKEATEELQKMEIEAGSDLADLRGLSDTTVGSTNRLMLDMVRDELRKADLAVRTMEPNYQLAKSALVNPSLTLQASETLKDTHPAISRLREGLAEARVKTANLEGRFTANHPEVRNSRQIEAAFQENILKELAVVVEGYQASIAISQQKINALNGQEKELGKRLNRLADIRAEYSNMVAEVKSRSESLSQIKKELTRTMASRDAAQAASLLTRLDAPVIGEKPVGPGRTTIVGGAAVGGLLFGLGVVFLFIPLDGLTNSREIQSDNPLPSESPNRSDAAPVVGSQPDTAPQSKRKHSADEWLTRQPADSRKASAKIADVISVPPTSPTTTTAAPTPSNTNVTKPAPTTAVQSSTLVPPATTRQQSVAPAAQPQPAAAVPALIDSQTIDQAQSIDEVRDLIANALKCHVKEESI